MWTALLIKADKSAEILSNVCQKAREQKMALLAGPHASILPNDTAAPTSTTSTLRATVTGQYSLGLQAPLTYLWY